MNNIYPRSFTGQKTPPFDQPLFLFGNVIPTHTHHLCGFDHPFVIIGEHRWLALKNGAGANRFLKLRNMEDQMDRGRWGKFQLVRHLADTFKDLIRAKEFGGQLLASAAS